MKRFLATTACVSALLCGSVAQSSAVTPAMLAARVASLNFGVNADNVDMGAFVYTYGTADVAAMQAAGMTCVRIPVDAGEVVTGLPSDYLTGLSDQARVDKGFAKLDAAVMLFEQAGMSVIIAPFTNPAIVALGPDALQAAILSADTALAKRYAPQYPSRTLFFDLDNEPMLEAETWNVFAPQLDAAMRQYAPMNTFLIGPIKHNKPDYLVLLTKLVDSNVIYVMHHYEPVKLVNQGMPGTAVSTSYVWPKPTDATAIPTEYTEAKTYAFYDEAIAWATAKGVPMIVEEFGTTNVVGDVPSRDRWIAGNVHYMKSKNLGHLWWSWSSRLFGLNPHGRGLDTRTMQLLATP